jgi:4-hydroxythreonine-4-phosphate dehydrogenase
MKVFVTQGHEKGIGLEVFFKTCLMSAPSDLSKLVLLAYPSAIHKTLRTIKVPYTLTDSFVKLGGLKIPIELLNKTEYSESFTALKEGMRLSERGGVLFTLPTSKDQFPNSAGHTEFFRAHYHKPELGMFFSSPKLNVLLLSDHIPLSAVAKTLSAELLESRLKEAIQTLTQWNRPIKKILISGFNPHAGEGGLIGTEDDRIKTCIKHLSRFTPFEMSGPLPGDTMLLEQRSVHDLLVYVYHDQGLAAFKGLQGLIGANITLGLPYPRISPDHGTSFGLFGKNIADYRGCAFSLKEALTLLKRMGHGKNSSY